MVFDFPNHIQQKLDNLTPRQFEALTIHVELPLREYEDIDERYRQFRDAWNYCHPVDQEALDYLGEVLRCLIRRIEAPSMPPYFRGKPHHQGGCSTPPSGPRSPKGGPPAQNFVQGTFDLRDMPPAGTGFRVAFSFAGEQRDLVRSIAEACEARLGRGTVFYDEWFQHVLGGYGAEMFLQNIYGKQTQMIVLCVASNYAVKPWTMAEHDAIMARIMALRASADPRDRYRYLPIRVGDGEVPGVLTNTIAIDARAPARSPEQIAEIIVRRLAEIDA